MFETLGERLQGVLDRLKGKGALTELEVRAAMREVRVALLEADVALPVVKSFVDEATQRAVGQDVLRSVTPGQQVVKVVHDTLVETLGGDVREPRIEGEPPAVVMLVGLQGSGKTTTTAKLGRHFRARRAKRVLMASLDVHRPAAQEQLAVLGRQAEVATLPVVAGQQPVDIARRALQAARLQGHDVLLLDTAGRLHVDEALMAEMAAIADVTTPAEVLLVVDALTGQDAVQVAERFQARVPLTGVILTRMDGDARGGAALSMRRVTGRPILFAGTGEKLDGLEPFHPERVAGRILGMGDVVSLVERAAETVDHDEAEKLAQRMAKGRFDMNDMLGQFRQMGRMGGLGALAGMLPGMGRMIPKGPGGVEQAMAAAGVGEKTLKRMEAVILSMTPGERGAPEVLNARRKIRVANGAGVTVQEVNKLLKMHQEMANAMKRIRKMGGLEKMAAMFAGKAGGGLPELPPGLLPGGMQPRQKPRFKR